MGYNSVTDITGLSSFV